LTAPEGGVDESESPGRAAAADHVPTPAEAEAELAAEGTLVDEPLAAPAGDQPQQEQE
jgi:hypothetical protein